MLCLRRRRHGLPFGTQIPPPHRPDKTAILSPVVCTHPRSPPPQPRQSPNPGRNAGNPQAHASLKQEEGRKGDPRRSGALELFLGACASRRGAWGLPEKGPGRHNGPHPLSPRFLVCRISGPRAGGAGGSRDGIGLASFLGGLLASRSDGCALWTPSPFSFFQGSSPLCSDRLRGGVLRLRRRYHRWIRKPGRDQRRLLSVSSMKPTGFSSETIGSSEHFSLERHMNHAKKDGWIHTRTYEPSSSNRRGPIRWP